MMTLQSKLVAFAAAAVAAVALPAPVHAQQVYRIVGPDGRVTYSDKPPAADSGAKTTTTSGAPGAAAPGSAALPFELRQVATRYPVTLYTGDNCSPCNSARNLLVGRGVPFTERTVKTNEDIEALQRLSGDPSLPFATVGGQQLKGFSDVEWSQFLDAAGYPKTSQLPASYRNPPATPLVAVQRSDDSNRAARTASAASAAAPSAPPPPAPSIAPPDNPSGIRF